MITEIQYIIGLIVGKFEAKILKTEDVPKMFAPAASAGQAILEHPLSKNLKPQIF